MKTYKETKNKVKVRSKRSGAKFWTRKGYPMSPILFNVYVMNLEENIKKKQTEGVVVGREKFSIITANDIISLRDKYLTSVTPTKT